ncbi:MAG: hypothetical protein A2X34_02335 [Elusimicrobia bacterium GWC2_51_8]|nr:MAG: hypothetical protein A2X33_05190 [Elusimicrobia bacterium GWA2_51_34]OGR59673.1 MAG: hypothetical protein A2X34_02335 [Elusimicrobia bacterium GWC2_51_8]OGR87261.1 MAG: hypothetical protein A2021_02835 [Elusimicrobia bacterium GWF2_52_66]HAF95974.1 hypothetical protein [Elusimicrobiota bacterium]HCE99075.1 hypothetical protein [Elusimicrobiota bacterium]
MKILLALVCLLAAGVKPLCAQKAGDFGAGVILGNPTGAAAKFWLNDSRALDAGVGFNTDLALYGDYLWHSWKVLPQPSEGRLPVYLGLGAQIMDSAHNNFGLRAVAGIAYWLPRNPVEIFLELVPVLRFSNNDGVDLNAGIGLRYYFKRS